MTEQEAIKSALKKLKEQRENFGILERPTVDENSVIRKALEKQIPKKPIECTDLYPPKQYECPNCGYCVGKHKYMKPTHLGDVLADCKVEFRYCGDCGQAIDWSDEE